MVRKKQTKNIKNENSVRNTSVNKSANNKSKFNSLDNELNDAPNDMSARRKTGAFPRKVFNLDTERTLLMNRKTFKEIRRLQNRTDRLIPVSPFLRLIREILMVYGGPEIRIQRTALNALQEACELYMTQFFQDSYLLSFHCKRVTLMVKDMQLARRLRGLNDIVNR